MKRKLFCEISPFTYKLSTYKCRLIRSIENVLYKGKFACVHSDELLPVVLYKHKSLMRRKLGQVNPQLQENKVINLGIAAPKVTGLLIKPNEVFSFWKIVGHCSKAKGYLSGLTIRKNEVHEDIGGGMCQFTNLIHWMVLHSPLEIVEHHHHDRFDLFPDYGRQIPFGTGTSIFYNYIDYRFKNNTDQMFQLITYVDDEYLCGEIRCEQPLNVKYHVKCEDEMFVQKEDAVYRLGKIYRETINAKTGVIIKNELIKENNAKLMYERVDV